MMYQLDKDEIKNNLSIQQVMDLVSELGGDPRLDKYGDFFTAQTICHNIPGEGSYKLYYYDNTKLFHCYSGCGDSFDIFDLVKRSKNTIGEKVPNTQGEYVNWELHHAVNFVAKFFNFTIAKDYYKNYIRLQDWDILNKYEQIVSHEKADKKEIILKEYDKKVIENMPLPLIKTWYDEGISYETMVHFGIKYNPVHHSIIIPHYDINDRLVGIRERTLIKENEKYGKYRPAYINGIMYNHPLSFNLYNINNSKDNIKAIKKVIVFEGKR